MTDLTAVLRAAMLGEAQGPSRADRFRPDPSRFRCTPTMRCGPMFSHGAAVRPGAADAIRCRCHVDAAQSDVHVESIRFTDLMLSLRGGVRCLICLEHQQAGAADHDAGLPCGHPVCAECAFEYVRSLVGQGRVASRDLCCPDPSCRGPLPEAFVSRLLGASPEGERLLQRLLEFQARRFEPAPEDGEVLVACPSAGCGKVLIPEELVARKEEVTCLLCVRSFCAACCQPAHRGISCEAAELERMDPRLRELIARAARFSATCAASS
ncbi:unnamed protein product [Prorocentrum cordatum]|uniref:RBR-type E3 ubiquitin transferase n=1 Tax=Prorocentrum cordatum TaxID=2364126 RepID=A0ABN9W1X6_9DINO|nr:unnamed protein product [Polarella glacialis]